MNLGVPLIYLHLTSSCNRELFICYASGMISRRNKKVNLPEVTQYVADIETMTRIRARELASGNAGEDELTRYDTAIEVMQLVLIELNTRNRKGR